MHGRITKSGTLYYCVVKGKIYPVEINTDKKINNGDLVRILHPLYEGPIKSSDFEIFKKNSTKGNFLNIDDSTQLLKRLENRILDLRRPINHARFLFRSNINRILPELFDRNGFTSVNTPLIVGPLIEGRVKTFNIDFFGREASLTMTKLVHLRYLIFSDFEKVYDLSPVLVGGTHKTSNHVAEYFTLDWASSGKGDFSSYLKFTDKILLKLLAKLSKHTNSSDLNIDFGLKILEIEEASIITYDELMGQYLAKNSEDSKVLTQFHIPDRVIKFAHNHFGKYLWVVDFPKEFKQFYCDTIKRENKEVVLASELWWDGVKVASVSFSNSDYEKTLSRIKGLGLLPRNFKTYLNALKLAPLDAYLGSLYIERLMMVILNIGNMKETILFPRAASGTVLDP